VLAQTLLNGGSYGGTRILSEDSVDALFHNENAAFPGNSHGLGFELDQRWYMDGLSGPETAGHTGYTGTSIVIDRASRSFVILLTNRVHPTRDWGSNNPSRRAVARDLARALAVHPLAGDEAWFSGVGDARTATLSAPAASGGALSFGLWYDTEAGSDEARDRAGREQLTGKRLQRLTLGAIGDQNGDATRLDAAIAGPRHE